MESTWPENRISFDKQHKKLIFYPDRPASEAQTQLTWKKNKSKQTEKEGRKRRELLPFTNLRMNSTNITQKV